MNDRKTQIALDRLEQVVGGANMAGTNSDDRLVGTSAADVISGGAGNDQMFGGAGSDVLVGGEGNDTLVGGAGQDTLTGGGGSDTFIWNIKDGSDVIKDFDPSKDTICIPGARSWEQVLANVNTSRFQAPNQTTITFDGAKLVIEGIKPADLKPEWFGFMHEGNETLTGGASDDAFDGEGGNDVLNGGGGNDVLTGGSGNDTFVYDPANGGKDVIADFRIGQDKIAITGIPNWAALQDHIFSAGGDTLIRFGDGSLTLRGVNAADLSAKDFGLLALNGGAGNDVLKGTNVNDSFDGAAGNDTLLGGGGGDILSGGGGDDRLDGGTGNDTLTGGAGADAFVWNARSGGIDRVTDFDPARDKIVIEGVETWQQILAAAGRSLDSRHTTITFGSNKLTIENVKLADLKPEWFGFVHEGDDIMTGGTGNDALNGSGGNDQLNGGAGNDVLTGGVGKDTFVFNAQGGGHDRITDFKRGEDIIRIEGATNWSELKALMRSSGGDTVICFPGGATLTIAGEVASELKPEHFGFAPQAGTGGNDGWTGTRDNEAFDGGAGRDTLNGGGGNDTLTGGGGGDLFVFEARKDAGHDVIKDFKFAEGDRISIPGMSWAAILNAATSDPVRNQVTLKFGDKWLTIEGARREDLTPAMFGLAVEVTAATDDSTATATATGVLRVR